MVDSPDRRKNVAQKAASVVFSVVSGVMFAVIQILILGRTIVDYLKLRYVDFDPRPDDIFIATYPRSGTTWMQMILYQMTSDGEMGFQHISAVCPWFERTIVTGRDLNALPSPRIFKTHLRYYLLPKRPCRHIYVVRDGKDVAVSLFHFYQSHFGSKSTFSQFFKLFLRGKVEGGSWFGHVAGWWAHRNDSNVLFLKYEDLVNDLEGSIRKIGAFCGIDLPAERMPRILERSSFAFMKQHEAQFDHTTETQWEQGVQPNSFLRKGKAGEGWKDLSPREQEMFDELLAKKLGPLKSDYEARPPSSLAQLTPSGVESGSRE